MQARQDLSGGQRARRPRDRLGDLSTAGNYDILAKFHVDDGVDIGHFVAENVQTIPEIQDTRTIITFKAF